MRKLIAVAIFYSINFIAYSQNITVEGTAPGLYITHVVAPKENFYSISRLYNQPPKLIAAFNKIEMEKGLTIGQLVKVPLNAQNFDGKVSSHSNRTFIPLTHVVAKSENIFKIGSNLHVTAQSIRKWNNLSSDKVVPGTPLIVGYLKTGNAHSFATVAKTNSMQAADTKAEAGKRVEAHESKEVISETKKDDPFISGSPASDEMKDKQNKERRQDNNGESIKDTQAVSNSNAAIAEKDSAIAVIPEETPKLADTARAPVKEEPVLQQETSPTKTQESKGINQATEPGIAAQTFEDIYAMQSPQKAENSKSGEAATFKSTSGWQDKKYYVLINDVTPGTIVKIASSENKAVYAKVLGSMPEMKENNGLLLRISNAAASYLGIIDPKFPVQISYYQ